MVIDNTPVPTARAPIAHTDWTACDVNSEAGGYLLGVLWGAAGCAGPHSYWLRHQDRWYLDFVREALQLSANVRPQRLDGGIQWRLRIMRPDDVRALEALLTQYGWSPRRADLREYPVGPIHDQAFIRAWVELHGSADITDPAHRKIPRLRIYGNMHLIDRMNQIIAEQTDLAPRRLQRTSNHTTKALYYIGGSMRQLLAWLYAGATVLNPTAHAHLTSF
jgi:hypothetical protein